MRYLFSLFIFPIGLFLTFSLAATVAQANSSTLEPAPVGTPVQYGIVVPAPAPAKKQAQYGITLPAKKTVQKQSQYGITLPSYLSTNKQAQKKTTSVVTSNGLCKGQSGLCNPLKVNSIQALLVDILSYLVKIGTIFIVLMLVFVGFKFVAARGNSGDLEKARTMLLWTIIGALIILGAQAISMGVASTISAISQTP